MHARAQLGSRVVSAPEIRTVGVVGLGAMGAGIAQLAIQAGYKTIGHEITDELGVAARERISHFIGRRVDKAQMTAAESDDALGRLSSTTDLSDLADCDLVIEAIVEDLESKTRAVRRARARHEDGRDSRDEHIGVVRHRDRSSGLVA